MEQDQPVPPVVASSPIEGVVPRGTVLLEVENVSVTFGNFVAVRGANFSMRTGTLLGLIGPNGSGKTTLLRAIASLQATSSGVVRVLGEVMKPGDETAGRMIGFTPDVPPAYEALTVRQFLDFIAAGYGITAENTGPMIDFWLEKVWLQDKRNHKVRSLSRGMRQRLGIARTLLPNPQIILLDEPASGLDPAGRAQFRRLLADLRDQGKTLIVSSHILSDMEEYCTHAAIMSHGSIIKVGTVREVAEGADTGRCRYVVELSEPVAGLADTLGKVAGISGLKEERLSFSFEYSSERADSADMLRRMVQLGLPVAGFQAQQAGLEEAYLRAGIRQVD